MKVGFVTILGRPNVGKSTLLNKIIDYKLSITSSTPQTTRNKIKGIYNDNDSQIIFVDTPGIHKPKQKLGENLNNESYSSLKDCDITLFLSPINEKIGPGDKIIIEKLKLKNVAIITKLDMSNMQDVEKRVQELKNIGFKNVLGVSVKIKDSIDTLLDFLKEKLPEGELFYDKEDITDINLKFIVKETIRESAIELTNNELPHSIGVVINDFQEEENYINVQATIYVEKESQKGIVIGKNGSLIKKIGVNTRKKIKENLGYKNSINLKVKVAKKWTKKYELIKKMGY